MITKNKDKQSYTVIVGLGNPGIQYNNTRHNIGFMLLDLIVTEFDFQTFRKKFDGLISIGKIYNKHIILFKPYTFINNSGGPLLKLISFFKIHPKNIIVIHDEADIPFSKIKIKKGGGTGGHNGLNSINEYINNDYLRLRVGIGKDDLMGLSKHVLSGFKKEENITQVLTHISCNFKFLLTEDQNSSFNNNLSIPINEFNKTKIKSQQNLS